MIISDKKKTKPKTYSQQSGADKRSGTRAEFAVRVKTRPSGFCLGFEGGVVACQPTHSWPPRTYDSSTALSSREQIEKWYDAQMQRFKYPLAN